jgi:hypothetical protein
VQHSINFTGKIKLADFGASKRIESLVTMGDGYKTFTGTPYFMVRRPATFIFYLFTFYLLKENLLVGDGHALL